jgi:hypothetical protein
MAAGPAECVRSPVSLAGAFSFLHDPAKLSRFVGGGYPCTSKKLSLWNWREWIIWNPLRLDDEPWRVSDSLISHLIARTRQRDDDLVEHQVDKNV